jgi:hypothetical protein
MAPPHSTTQEVPALLSRQFPIRCDPVMSHRRLEQTSPWADAMPWKA